MPDAVNKTPVATTSEDRRRRPARVGVVTSDVRDKTISVTVRFQVTHSKYGKIMGRRTVLQAHDEKNEAAIGDRVEITECRPISKTKCWRLLRIVEKAPRGSGA